jgi:hypothetical protein
MICHGMTAPSKAGDWYVVKIYRCCLALDPTIQLEYARDLRNCISFGIAKID